MWWIQLRECFLSQSNRKECHAMCECVCVWLAYDHHQVPYEYESIYIYIYIYIISGLYWQFKRSRAPFEETRSFHPNCCQFHSQAVIGLLLSWRNIPQSLGMIHPGRLPMSIMRRLIDILGIKLVRLNPFWSSFIGHCLCHVEHCSALQSSLNSTHQVFSRRWQTIPQIQMIHRIKQMQ